MTQSPTPPAPRIEPTRETYFTLREANKARAAAWELGGTVPMDLAFRGLELAGEAGEAANVMKKLERERRGWRGSRETVEHLAEELADVQICNDLAAMTADIDLEAAVVAKFNATSEKVGLPHRLSLSRSPDAIQAAASPAVQAAKRACFHYFHCGSDDGCGKLAPSMADLALAIGFDEESVLGDDIRAEAIQAAVEAERERCAQIADGFTCGACGMDGLAGKAIRASASQSSFRAGAPRGCEEGPEEGGRVAALTTSGPSGGDEARIKSLENEIDSYEAELQNAERSIEVLSTDLAACRAALVLIRLTDWQWAGGGSTQRMPRDYSRIASRALGVQPDLPPGWPSEGHAAEAAYFERALADRQASAETGGRKDG